MDIGTINMLYWLVRNPTIEEADAACTSPASTRLSGSRRIQPVYVRLSDAAARFLGTLFVTETSAEQLDVEKTSFGARRP